MEIRKVMELFQFKASWIDLGIVTPKILEELLVEYEKGEDPYIEHYRWRAFKNFLSKHQRLDEHDMMRLYEFVKNDSDPKIGESMIHALIKRDDFPIKLLEKETSSENKSLARVAFKELNKRKNKELI